MSGRQEGVAEVMKWLIDHDLDVLQFLQPLVAAGIASADALESMSDDDASKIFKGVQLRKFRTAQTAQRKRAANAPFADLGKSKRFKKEFLPVEKDSAPKLELIPVPGSEESVCINRSPVMILWGAVVAEKLGFDWDSALSLSSMMAGLNARAKGESLGIFSRSDRSSEANLVPSGWSIAEVSLLGRKSKAAMMEGEGEKIRIFRGFNNNDGNLIRPSAVFNSLQRSFGDSLQPIYAKMRAICDHVKPEILQGADNRAAFDIYCVFRPKIPSGRSGWGARGQLVFREIESVLQDRRFVEGKDESSSLMSFLLSRGKEGIEKNDSELEKFSRSALEALQLEGLAYEREGKLFAT